MDSGKKSTKSRVVKQIVHDNKGGKIITTTETISERKSGQGSSFVERRTAWKSSTNVKKRGESNLQEENKIEQTEGQANATYTKPKRNPKYANVSSRLYQSTKTATMKSRR